MQPVAWQLAGGGRTEYYGASDLHLTVGVPPMMRRHGSLMPVPDYPRLRPDELRNLVYSVLPQRQPEESRPTPADACDEEIRPRRRPLKAVAAHEGRWPTARPSIPPRARWARRLGIASITGPV